MNWVGWAGLGGLAGGPMMKAGTGGDGLVNDWYGRREKKVEVVAKASL